LDNTFLVAFTGAVTILRVTSTTADTERLTGWRQEPLKQSPAKTPEDITDRTTSRIKFFINFLFVNVKYFDIFLKLV
jgi:hypothetical protein